MFRVQQNTACTWYVLVICIWFWPTPRVLSGLFVVWNSYMQELMLVSRCDLIPPIIKQSYRSRGGQKCNANTCRWENLLTFLVAKKNGDLLPQRLPEEWWILPKALFNVNHIRTNKYMPESAALYIVQRKLSPGRICLNNLWMLQVAVHSNTWFHSTTKAYKSNIV